jgi:hypothetical protein
MTIYRVFIINKKTEENHTFFFSKKKNTEQFILRFLREKNMSTTSSNADADYDVQYSI